MSNMSYCQFENTYRDLHQCYNAMDDGEEDSEAEFKKKLIDLCKKIAEEYGDEEDE